MWHAWGKTNTVHTVFQWGNMIGRKHGTSAPRWEGNTKPSKIVINLSYT